MQYSELSPKEQLVLVGLVKAIVHADQQVSSSETVAIGELASELGIDAWNRRVAEARDRFSTATDLFDMARTGERDEARELIHHALRRVAESDELIDQELAILEWVAEVWQLGGAVVDDLDVDEETDDGTFDGEFELFDPATKPSG